MQSVLHIFLRFELSEPLGLGVVVYGAFVSSF